MAGIGFDHSTEVSSTGYICRGEIHPVTLAGLKEYVVEIEGNVLAFHIYPHKENCTHPNTAKAVAAVNGTGTVDGFAHDQEYDVTDKSSPSQPKRSKNGQGQFKLWTINIFCTDGLEQGLLHGNSGQCQRLLMAVYRTIAEYKPRKVLMFFHDLAHYISPLSITFMFACHFLVTTYTIDDPLFHPLPPIPADNGDRLSQDTTACMSHRKCRRLILYRENLLRNKNGLEHRLASKEDKYECVIKAPTLWEIYGTFKNVDPNLLSKGWEPAL